MPNALADESSPYLRQHADNPVNWVAWSPAAFAEAQKRDVPVLISIGYSTCHWCHVMAHESFEDGVTASQMNANYVCIKVDREEHPEVDAIYMDAVQALTGHGGWPLNAFADHDGRPFYACTYLPTPNWRQLLDHLTQIWNTDRVKIATAAKDITAHLTRDEPIGGKMPQEAWALLDRALERTYDRAHPGYSYGPQQAPKFPASQLLPLLLQSKRQTWVDQAARVLEAMQDAGIHDRVGGGFHRYSVDRKWRLPHFEKMLYDNAQLIATYARAGAQVDRPDFIRTAMNAGDYLLRDMRVISEGEFHGYAAAEDADDPGGEGSFYAWSSSQLTAIVGEAAGKTLMIQWDIMAGHAEPGPSGHAEPVVTHIPHPRGATLETMAPNGDVQALRASWEPYLPTLLAARALRPRPGRDDKVLTDQNGLALEAFAALGRWGGKENGEERFVAACRELAAIVIARQGADGLKRTARLPAFITDYGSALTGLTAAFDLLGDPALIDAAIRIADEAVTKLRAEDGGFYVTPAGREDLVRRGREQTDNVWPSGQNVFALGFVRLWNLTGATKWKELAEGVFNASAAIVAQAPSACSTLLTAWLQLTRGHLTAVVAGDPALAQTRDLLAACRRSVIPGLAIVPVATCRAQKWDCLDGRTELSEPQALICLGTVCLAPAKTVLEVNERLASAAKQIAPV
ncbi:MAG TPA: thioredoxin domain-containing protein [Planctomycetota bacterium]|nr:thioredoxin domain-containing protein [Planctomycetota bacterium]